jgi:hypothetical protein
MSKKIFVPLLALALATPLYMASAVATTNDETDTTSTVTTDCGSAPTAPKVGATVQERQQYRLDLQTYNQCQKENMKNQRQQLAQDKCDLVNQKINDKLSSFQSKQNGDKTIFGNVYQRLTNLSTRLKGNGLDTSALDEDLATLKTKIEKVSTDYASFVAELKETTNFTCGQSQGQFMGKLGAARGILMTVRQDRLDVKSYILNTIKPDILALRKQLVKKEGSKTSADDSSANSDSSTAGQ